MKKISNLLMMALLTIGMGLTSCDEQLDNAVTPVVDEVTSITVDLSKIDEKYLDTEKTKLQLTVGDEVTLSFTILPEEMASTEVELTAADATILSIDGLKVKALKEGETKVTAKAGDKTAECTVTVKAATAAKTLAEATAGDIGKIAGKDGKIYASKADAEAVATGNAVAMIAYVGNDAETSPTNTTYNHGLALALEDVSVVKTWCSQTDATCLGTGHQFNSGTDAKGDMAGIYNTNHLILSPGSHTHDAAKAAREYNDGTHPAGTSAWFLPSAGQWDKMATAAGSYANLKTNAGLLAGAYYWSSSENNANCAWDFYSNSGYWSVSSKAIGDQVRACLAF